MKLQNCINSIYKNKKDSGKTKIDYYTYKYKKRSFGNYSKIILLNISYQESLTNKINTDFCFGWIHKPCYSTNNKYFPY